MNSLHDDCLFGVGFSFLYILLNKEIAHQQDDTNKGRVTYIKLGAKTWVKRSYVHFHSI